MRQIPDELREGPFTHLQAQASGVTPRMLMGKRFVQLFPRVYRCSDYALTPADWIEAARLALPDDVQLTGITRIQEAGLDYGLRWPLRFVIARDHHIAIDGIFLHRTVQMPPTDASGVCPAAAFIAYCAKARVIDAIKVGDWLLRQHQMSLRELQDLALAQVWRDGAPEALWVLEYLDGDSRSVAESELRAILEFAGLPCPDVNRPLELQDGVVVTVDLLYRKFGVAIEYEGRHHQEDREQYLGDLYRYAAYRRDDVRYVQVTKEKQRLPRNLCGEIYRELVAGGYDGPPPEFGERWDMLFSSVASVVGPRKRRSGRNAG